MYIPDPQFIKPAWAPKPSPQHVKMVVRGEKRTKYGWGPYKDVVWVLPEDANKLRDGLHDVRRVTVKYN